MLLYKKINADNVISKVVIKWEGNIEKLINSKNGHKLKAVAINTFNNSLT